MEDRPEDRPDGRPEDKPKLTVRGLEFTIVTDALNFPVWEIELERTCPDVSISVHLYGTNRPEAMNSAVRELAALVVNHQSRCWPCQEAMTYQLIGDDDDSQVSDDDLPKE